MTSVGIVVLTSVRDTGGCDQNGCWVPTPSGQQYMRGAVEELAHQCSPGGALYGLFHLAAVVTDDREKDLRGSGCSAFPRLDQRWIHPLDLMCVGRRVVDMTYNVESEFRFLPRDDTLGRARKKLAFEDTVMGIVSHVDAGVILSDHYMARIEHLHKLMPGKVLNIHPAVTCLESPFCFRGKTPTADAIRYAVEHPEMEVRTGATLHHVVDEIDAGPIIHWDGPTRVFSTDVPPLLRLRNYREAKLPVLIEGLRRLR